MDGRKRGDMARLDGVNTNSFQNTRAWLQARSHARSFRQYSRDWPSGTGGSPTGFYLVE